MAKGRKQIGRLNILPEGQIEDNDPVKVMGIDSNGDVVYADPGSVSDITKVSQLINDVPYIRSVNDILPDIDGDLTLELSTTSYVNAACVVRINSSTGIWEIVNDAVHKPIYITSIENLEIPGFSTFNFRLNYPTTEYIGTLLGASDETYSSQGYLIGGSVGASSSNMRITKTGMSIGFNCTSGVWTMITDPNAIAMPSNFSSSFNSSNGELTITHTALIFTYADGIFLEGLNINYRPEFVSKTATSFTIRFLDSLGNVILVANDSMDFNVNRTGVFRVPNANLLTISAAANFWIQGIFYKTGVSGNIPFDYPIDTYPIDNSSSLITSGGVYDFVQDQKQNLQQVTDKGSITTLPITTGGLTITGGVMGNLLTGNGSPTNGTTFVRDRPIGADNGSSADLIAGTTTVNNSIWQLRNRKANLDSPIFVGNPTAPTPTAGDNDTSIATTAFVTTAVNNPANNKVTKGGDSDGVSLVIGTNDGNNVIIRRNGGQRVVFNAIGTEFNTSLSGGSWTEGSLTFAGISTPTIITSARTDAQPVLSVQNTVTGGTGDLVQFKKNISSTLTTVCGVRPDGRAYGSDATAANDFITKGQYDLAKAIVDSALTTTQTAATLNAKYPSVPFPYVVFAPNVGSSMTYVKVNATQWMSYSGVLLS